MTTFTFDEEETLLLQQILEEYMSELRTEIADTDNYGYKEMLKSKKTLLLQIQKVVNESQTELIAG